MYISRNANESGAYPAPQSHKAEGLVSFPDEFMDDFIKHNGFVILTVENNVVTGVTPNVEAWEAWKNRPVEEVIKEPTQLDKIEAQVAYTAMMTDTLIV